MTKPLTIEIAPDKTSLQAALLGASTSMPLGGRMQTLGLNDEGFTVSFTSDAPILEAVLDGQVVANRTVIGLLRQDDGSYLVAVPQDTSLETLSKLAEAIEAISSPSVGVVNERLHHDYIEGGELMLAEVVKFNLLDGNVTGFDRLMINGEQVLNMLGTGGRKFAITASALFDADRTALASFDGIDGVPTTIIDGDSDDTKKVYFYEVDKGFKVVTFNIADGSYVEGETYFPTPGIKRINGEPVWAKPVNDPSTPRGWNTVIPTA